MTINSGSPIQYITEQTVLMGLSGLLDHTAVIHELLAHPGIDLAAQVARRGLEIFRVWPTGARD